jgi:HEAT repeat protein
MPRAATTVAVLCVSAAALTLMAEQAPPTDATVLGDAIDRLGTFDFETRTEAARVVRRASPDRVVPALVAAVRAHRDEYVRYRAMVLLAGFVEDMPSTRAAEPVAQLMQAMIGDRNDRVRTVAYQWFEYHPDASVLPRLLEAINTERSEFIRPALTRALAAHGDDLRVRDALLLLVLRGDDYFRGAVIGALGDHKAQYALPRITEVAQLDGPLQDDAITALGRIGERSARTTLAALQQSLPRELQPTVSAAFCLLGIDCDARAAYVREALLFAASTEGYQPLLRGAVHATAMLAIGGREDALSGLFQVGLRVADPARAAIALGIGTVALRRPLMLLTVLERTSDVREAILLVREAFDMLAEDFEEERFYVQIRRAHWEAPPDSTRRRTAATLIEITEF